MTYVLLPAFALYQSGMIGEPWSFVAAGLIVVSSAIYYADMGMKTDEYFFSGFPVVWNMVVFTLFVIEPGEWTSFAVVVVSAAAFRREMGDNCWLEWQDPMTISDSQLDRV